MVISAYINFKGDCKAAVEFYGQVFNETPKIMTYGQMPPDPNVKTPAEMKDLVMHSELEICGNKLFFSDIPSNMEFVCGNNITIFITSEDEDKVSRWYEELSNGGRPVIPLARTFWSRLYGYVIDKFGVGWQIGCSE